MRLSIGISSLRECFFPSICCCVMRYHSHPSLTPHFSASPTPTLPYSPTPLHIHTNTPPQQLPLRLPPRPRRPRRLWPRRTRRHRLAILPLPAHHPPQHPPPHTRALPRLPQTRLAALAARQPRRHARLPRARGPLQMHQPNHQTRHLVRRRHPPHHPLAALPLLQQQRRRGRHD